MDSIGWGLALLALAAAVAWAVRRAVVRRGRLPGPGSVPSEAEATTVTAAPVTTIDAPGAPAADAQRLADGQARLAAQALAAEQAAEQAALRAAYEQAAADAERREALALAEAARRAQDDEDRRAAAQRHAREDAERRARAQAERARAEAERARAEAAEQARLEAEERARAEAAERARAEAAERARAEAAERARAEAAASRAVAAAAAAPRTAAQTLVMVADDSKVVRVKTSRVLAKHGYRFALAEDGQQALALLDTELPHLVITDVEMPGVDGFELTRRLRADPRTARLPIIMITAADDRLRSAAAEAGVTVVLGKPYEDDMLLAHIEALAGVGTAAAAVA